MKLEHKMKEHYTTFLTIKVKPYKNISEKVFPKPELFRKT